LSDYSKEVELIFEMKDGKLNGRVVKIYIGVEQGIKNEIINFEEYTFIDSKANGKYIKWRNYTRKEINVEGYYLNNLKDSIWLDYYTKFADFALSSEAHYRYDKLHGRQKEWHPNGQLKSEKQCMFDDYIGKATLYYSNGRKYQDLFYLGGSSPFGENFKYVNIYDPKGKPLVVNGNGTHIILDENGAIWKTGPVKDGLRHGLWTKYPAGIFTSTETYNHGELID
jgi:antitoxin component YwqK of YwqJK toxin-antitoxin module